MDKPLRDGFGKALVELGKQNKNVVALSADLSGSVRTNWFSKEFPDRHFEAGICEQNMMGISSGLAACGKIPYVGSFAVFNPGRNLDQLRTSVCYSNMNVKVIGAHAGITVGEDGATHQATEDIAITRALPNMTVIVPCDYEEIYKATFEAAKINGPVYIRSGRPKLPIISQGTKFEIGKAITLREGNDITIIACGIMVNQALIAADVLEKEGVSTRVINMHTIKPIDKDAIIKAATETKGIVTAEEHQIYGGLGSAVAEVVAQHKPVKMNIIGLNSFGESGKPDELMEKYGLTSKKIVEAVKLI